MVMSIIIAVVMVAGLVVYFVMSKKMRTPTITTEILVSKYNKKVDKLSRFLKKNQIDFDCEKNKSRLEKSELTFDAVRANIAAMKAIEENNEIIEEAFIANSKAELNEKLKTLKANLLIKEFADELKPNEKSSQILEIMGWNKSKLNFELQRYFGSQTFFRHNEKYIFLYNSWALIVSEKNVFESEVVEFKIKIEKKDGKNKEKTKENGSIYEINLIFGKAEEKIELLVPQKEIEKILNDYNKKHQA